MAGAEFLMRLVRCQPASAQNFSDFGVLIDADGVTPELINDGTTRRFPDLAALDLGGAVPLPKIGIYVANARTFPLRIVKLERHCRASQVFIPLGMHRFIVVIAPGREAPEWGNVMAFLTSPGQGISLHRGTWHHGLVALNDADRFAVIEGGSYRTDTEEQMTAKEIWLADPFSGNDPY